jgi:hypothetical protein
VLVGSSIRASHVGLPHSEVLKADAALALVKTIFSQVFFVFVFFSLQGGGLLELLGTVGTITENIFKKIIKLRQLLLIYFGKIIKGKRNISSTILSGLQVGKEWLKIVSPLFSSEKSVTPTVKYRKCAG